MSSKAFSLLELIGVLAIIAILTALVLPRVVQAPHEEHIQAVHEANIAETIVALETFKMAVAAHLAQFGSLASQNGMPLNFSDAYDNFDRVLLTEGLVERPFNVRLGINSNLRLVRVSGLTTASTVDCSNGAYDLQGVGKNNMVDASLVLEAVFTGVREEYARALNDRIDGRQLAATFGQSDLRGRVIYPKPGPDGYTEVHVYLVHK